MIVHRATGRGGFLDEYRTGRAQCRQTGHDKGIGHGIARYRRNDARRGPCARHRGQPCQQPRDRHIATGDNGPALRGPCGVGVVVADQPRLARFGQMGAVAFDMIEVQRPAQRQHDVMRGKACNNRLARGGEETGKQRMVLGKSGARCHGGDIDTGAVPLGQGDNQIPRAIARNARGNDDGRAASPPQALRTLGQCGRVGVARGRNGPQGQRGARLIPIVDGHGDECRSTGRLHRHGIGAGDRCGHILCARGFDGPFDKGARKFARPFGKEEWFVGQDRARLLACGDYQRGLVPERGEHRAQSMADARRAVQIDQCGLARGRRKAVGHGYGNAFLQTQNIPEIIGKIAKHRQFGRAGVAEDRRHARRAQQVDRDIAHGRGASDGRAGGRAFGHRLSCGAFGSDWPTAHFSRHQAGRFGQ